MLKIEIPKEVVEAEITMNGVKFVMLAFSSTQRKGSRGIFIEPEKEVYSDIQPGDTNKVSLLKYN